jgi:hypothetical protein
LYRHERERISFVQISTKIQASSSTFLTTALADHSEEVQIFANSNPSQTGTVQHPFTDGVREAAKRSGEPMLYRGTTILAVLAKDITYEQYLGETTFSESNAWSGYLVNDFLSRLVSTEESNMGSGFWDPRAFHPRHVALIDFWPWLRHSRNTLSDAIRFARQHLSILRPLVVATFSQATTSIVRANFESENATPGLSSIVGEITIQYHGPEGNEDGEN